MVEQNTKRVPELDVLRGFGIYLSVLGHCITYGNGSAFKTSGAWQSTFLYRIIYSFHMPLLAAVSGIALWCSLQGKKNDSPLRTIGRKSFHLIIPIFSWGVFSSAFYYLFAPDRFPRSLSQFFWTCEEAYWFLSAMLICVFLTLTLHYAFHAHFICFGIVIVAFFLLPDTHSTAAQKTMFIYYYLSFLFAPFFLASLTSFSKRHIFLVISCAVIFTLLFPWFTEGKCFHVFSLNGYSDPLGRIIHVIRRVLLGVSGSVVFSYILICFAKKTPHIGNMFISLGKQSFGIYVLSSWLLEWALQRLTSEVSPSLLLTIAESVVITAVCYFSTILLKQIPFVDFLAFGGKLPSFLTKSNSTLKQGNNE